LNEGIRWPRKPQYVFVDLFKVDGTLRWLKGGGWLAGNLVAVAERVWGNHPSVLVENPEQIYKGIRIRFSMDTKSYQESVRKLVNLMGEIWAKR
jgi:hypothetical protein